jgi:hypothetical protein
MRHFAPPANSVSGEKNYAVTHFGNQKKFRLVETMSKQEKKIPN